MPLIVEDGTGIANAESLVTVAFMDTYHAERGNTLWAPISNDRKEQLARKATEYLTATYYGAWIGVAAYTGNNLPFPRKPTEPRHYGLYELGVPLEVKRAVAELALIADTVPLLPATIARGKKKVKVGPIEVEYDGNSPTQTKFVSASLLIVPYLRPIATTNMARLIRV